MILFNKDTRNYDYIQCNAQISKLIQRNTETYQPDKTRTENENVAFFFVFFLVQHSISLRFLYVDSLLRVLTYNYIFYSCNSTFVIITGQPSGTFAFILFIQSMYMRQNVIDVFCIPVHISHLRVEIVHRSRIHHILL